MSSKKTKNLEAVSINFLAAAGSHPGKQRENNEDRFVFDTNSGLFAVIDGMGGHSGGEIAAQIAAESIQTAIRRIKGSAEIRLHDSLIIANNSIFGEAHGNRELRGMGCVLTALLIEGETVVIAHVGDSRLYKIHSGKLEKLTIDHSPVGEIEDNGELSEIRLMRHPRRNEVSRCLGLSEKKFDETEFIDIFRTEFLPSQAFLICSDGLSDLLTSERILETIIKNAETPGNIVDSLIAEANTAGGKDNITVVFVTGIDFRQTLAGADAHLQNVFKGKRIFTRLTSRTAFLFYGLIIGGLIVFFYFYFNQPENTEILPVLF